MPTIPPKPEDLQGTPASMELDAAMTLETEKDKELMRLNAIIQSFRAVHQHMKLLHEENHGLSSRNNELRLNNNKIEGQIRKILAENEFLKCGIDLTPRASDDEAKEQDEVKKDKGRKSGGGNGGNGGNGGKGGNGAHHDAREKEEGKELGIEDRDYMENLRKENASLKETNANLEERNVQLYRELYRLSEEINHHKAPCGCDRRSFTRIGGSPVKEEGANLYYGALDLSNRKKEEKEKKYRNVYNNVFFMLKRATREYLKNTPSMRLNKEQKKLLHQITKERAEEIAEELLDVKDIGVHQVAQILEQGQIMPGTKLEIVETSRNRYRTLCELLSAKKSSEPYFEMLRRTVSDAMEIKIPNVWREMEGDNADDSLSHDVAVRATQYCRSLLGKHQLHPKVARTNSIRALQQIIRDCMTKPDCLPVTPENYAILISAVTKIRMMHLAETIKSQIDFKRNDRMAKHLQNKIDAHTDYTEDGKPVLTLRDNGEGGIYKGDDLLDSSSIVVDSVDVRDGKSEIPIARKFMVKDADNTNDFDPNQIYDIIGVRVMLTARDSSAESKNVITGEDAPDYGFTQDELKRVEKFAKSNSPLAHATQKVISILCAIFGSDIPKSRLRYTFDAGEGNDFSTGRHKAFHVTFRYRHQCVMNGLNGNNKPKMKSSYVELQVVVNMDKEEQEKDHDDYQLKKDRKIQNITGMDRPFSTWLSDLADVALDEKELDCSALDPIDYYNLTDKEISARMFFTAMTICDEKGNLVNIDAVETLLGDEMEKRKLKKLAKKYLHYRVTPRLHRILNGKEVGTNEVELNRLAGRTLQVIQAYEKD